MVPVYVHVLTFISIFINLLIIFLILRKREQGSLRMNWYLIGMISTIMMWIASVYLEETFFQFFPDLNLVNILGFTALATFSNIAIAVGLLLLAPFIHYLVEPILNFKQ